MGPVIRCLITDGSAALDEQAWLAKLAHWITGRGVDFVQIREWSLTTRELAALTRKVLALPNPHGTKILVNDRADVAIACGAHGVHLRDGSVSPSLFSRRGFTVSVSVHRLQQLSRAEGADFILLAPIFAPLSKTAVTPPLGTDAIRRARELTTIPLLALGGITESNARECVEAGAAGIAGISYFDKA
jgi:thiamine-phosphate pyrophosphorylase